MINGDTRFDRVLDLAKNKLQFEAFGFLTPNQKILVAGSTWGKDEELLAAFQQHNPDYKLIVAPHEIDSLHIQTLLKRFNHAALYSDLQKNKIEHPESVNVWIVDQIGILSQLYHLASITYVGGGYNASGIHNILEAAVWGRPVFFGPNYHKFREAKALLELGGCFSVSNYEQWEKVLSAWKIQPNLEVKSGEIAAQYVKENGGATERIMNYIYKNRLLTKASN
jgi:3-deoxy-D-manno-octulosonic-acid transferase